MESTNWDNSYISKCGARPTPADNLLTKTQWQEKPRFNKCCKQGYNTPVYPSIFNTPVHHGENEKLEIWRKFFLEKNGKIKCDFYSIILLMYHICAVPYAHILWLGLSTNLFKQV